jgi:predicted nucleotidyltransferase
MLAHYQRGLLDDPSHVLAHHDLYDCVIFRCVVGSRAYGLDQEGSDTDRRGIYLPPADLHWSLYGVPEQLENDATQEAYWELQKFLTLALKANPNVLECLFTPLVEHATPLAQELLAMRTAFVSRLAYQTYNGYVMSQFKKLEGDLRNRGQVKWKHVMHLIRLLLAGIQVLREGVVPVRVEEHRERLLAIRDGEVAWEEVDGWRRELHRQFDAALAETRQPERPDYERANAFLVRARRECSMETSPAVGAVPSPAAGFMQKEREPEQKWDQRLEAVIREQPFPLLFVTVSGAHLYGFPSPDSDYDLRGVHLLPLADVAGLRPARETIESSEVRDGLEIDLVTHDARKFFGLLLRKNGYVLEQLHSPLVLHTTPEHEELKSIAAGCITRHHAHHYLGFAATQWKLFEKESPRRVKPLLYVYRVLLTGIHLMRTGEVEANLLRLNEAARLSYLDDLVARKLAGPEQSTLPDADFEFHRAEYSRLISELESAHEKSSLPERAAAASALHDLLVRLRLGGARAVVGSPTSAAEES